MRVLSVVGNRPQFIKSAPLSLALRDAGIDEIVLHTGQHWDPEMSQVFFDELGIPEPAYRLDLRTADTDAMAVRDRASVVRGERPDWVLVFGDTNSTARRRTRRGRGARRARRGGPAELRPLDAGGAKPDRGRRALGAAPLPRRALGRSSSQPKASRDGVEVVGDVMADATRIFAPIARRRAAARRASRTPR